MEELTYFYPNPSYPIERDALDQVIIAFKIVFPVVHLDLDKKHKKFKNKFEDVCKFLIDFRSNKRKSLLSMAVDYFSILLDHYKRKLHFTGVRISHINSKRAKKLYERFVEAKNAGGLNYWDLWTKDGKTPSIISIPPSPKDILIEGNKTVYIYDKRLNLPYYEAFTK